MITYSQSKELVELGKRVRQWLLTNPGPISGHSPTHVYKLAVERFTEATGVECDYGFMVDYLFGVGIAADPVGALYWLRIPGQERSFVQRKV